MRLRRPVSKCTRPSSPPCDSPYMMFGLVGSNPTWNPSPHQISFQSALVMLVGGSNDSSSPPPPPPLRRFVALGPTHEPLSCNPPATRYGSDISRSEER